MIPGSFDYHRASSVEEAVRLLGELDDAKLLAGGHSLLPLMKQRLAMPQALIDIGRIDSLRGVDAGGDAIRIGALTTHTALAASDVLRSGCPLIAEAAAQIADPAVRNKGTIGGSIAHADPASDLPAVLLALGATIHVQGSQGARTVAASDFFTGLLETALGEGEILTAIDVLPWTAGTGAAYLKHEHAASGYAVCGAAAVVTLAGDRVSHASLALNGVAAVPFAAPAVGQALVGGDASEPAIAAAVDAQLVVGDPLEDVQASGEYRTALAKVYAKRALAAARDRAR